MFDLVVSGSAAATNPGEYCIDQKYKRSGACMASITAPMEVEDSPRILRETKRAKAHKKSPLKPSSVANMTPTMKRMKSTEKVQKQNREKRLKRKRFQVRFKDDVKLHDGLSPVSFVVDTLVWEYFNGRIKSIPDLMTKIEPKYLHHLSDVHNILSRLITETKKCPGVGVHVLPCGGGHSSMVCYPTHHRSLRFLRELIRRTHNRLHIAAVSAVSQRKESHEATAFVLEHMRLQEADYQRQLAQERQRQRSPFYRVTANSPTMCLA